MQGWHRIIKKTAKLTTIIILKQFLKNTNMHQSHYNIIDNRNNVAFGMVSSNDIPTLKYWESDSCYADIIATNKTTGQERQLIRDICIWQFYKGHNWH